MMSISKRQVLWILRYNGFQNNENLSLIFIIILECMSRSRWISEIAWNANLGHVLFKSLPEEYHREEKTSSRAPTGQWCYVSGRPVTCRLLSLVTCRHRLFSALCASLFVTRSLRNRGGHERGDTLLLVRDISKKFRFQTLCKLRIFTNSKYSTMSFGQFNYCWIDELLWSFAIM